MKKSKKMFVTATIFMITVLCVWFVLLDFSRFFTHDYSYDIFPSALLKRICAVLAALIAWSVGRDGLNPVDSRRMKAAFLFAILGEAAFAINERLVGVGLFGVCQTILIIRNGAGFFNGYADARYNKRKLLFLLLFIVLIIIIVFAFLFVGMGRMKITSLVVFLYGIVLSISLLTGLANYILQLLPRINSRLSALGMICFFCCDVLVGLDAALDVGNPWLLANSFIWVFYIPALTLLALSCYRYNSHMQY